MTPRVVRRLDAGFTLVEVLASIVLLTALAVALWPWLGQSARARAASTLHRGGLEALPVASVVPLNQLPEVFAQAGIADAATSEIHRGDRWVWMRIEHDGEWVARPFLLPEVDAE